MIAPFLPIILLASGAIALFVTGRPFWGAGAVPTKHARFMSLQATSSILNTLVSIAVVGKPILQHLQKNDWTTDLVPSFLVAPLTILAIASVYAMLAAVVFFFFRAIRNINFFSGMKLRSPYSAFFMLIPISNLVVIPYLEYFAYHRSIEAASPERASRMRAACLVASAFTLLVISLAISRLGEEATQASNYDPLSLLVLTVCTGGAGGILTTRIISGISKDQNNWALQHGLILDAVAGAAPTRGSKTLDRLKTASVAILLAATIVVAMFPTLPSRTIQTVYQL